MINQEPDVIVDINEGDFNLYIAEADTNGRTSGQHLEYVLHAGLLHLDDPTARGFAEIVLDRIADAVADSFEPS